MSTMRKSLQSRKAFTLVELIAIMAIMAIATALVLPNIRGMISNKEKSIYDGYCVTATTYTKNYVNLLKIGEERVPYVQNDKTFYYTIKDSSAQLTKAMNEYNLDKAAYQYYVLSYDATSATNDPTATIQEVFANDSSMKKIDVMIVCIIASDSTNSKVKTYELRGFWYYKYEASAVVYTYKVWKKSGQMGYTSLKKEK